MFRKQVLCRISRNRGNSANTWLMGVTSNIIGGESYDRKWGHQAYGTAILAQTARTSCHYDAPMAGRGPILESDFTRVQKRESHSLVVLQDPIIQTRSRGDEEQNGIEAGRTRHDRASVISRWRDSWSVCTPVSLWLCLFHLSHQF